MPSYLADVAADPGEQKNVRAQFPEIAEKLGKLHEQWRAAIANDPTASPDFMKNSTKSGQD